MHPLKTPSTLLALLLGACGGSDTGTATAPDPGTATGTTAPAPASTSDGHVTTGGETHAHATDHHDASTGHHDETAAEHGSAEHGSETGGGTPAEMYCFCMLENCHDQYHGTWGEEHPQSEEMCLAAAAAVPSVGMPAMTGNSLECRLHFCALGHDDEAACDIALGAAPCTD